MDAGPGRRTTAGPGVLRVLVVDDSRDAADSLALLVTIWGHDARVAYDGEAALESVAIRPPDVVLLDIGMPTMDGFHLAELLRRQTRLAATVLVAVTGYADEAHRRLWKGGIDHYLVKPVDPTTVERLLLRERSRISQPSAEVGGANASTAYPAGRAAPPPLVRPAAACGTDRGCGVAIILGDQRCG
jgi:CheY-like chemotaxis protein